MGFMPKFRGSSGSSSSIVASPIPPTDISKIWLDTSTTLPRWRRFSLTSSQWEILEDHDDDINDAIISRITTLSSEEIVERETFEYTQAVPSTVWVVDHPLDRMPSVTIIDDEGDDIIGDITYNSKTRVTITFSEAITGKVFLN